MICNHVCTVTSPLRHASLERCGSNLRRASKLLRRRCHKTSTCRGGVDAAEMEEARTVLVEEERKAAARIALVEAIESGEIAALRSAIEEGEAAGLEARSGVPS